MNLWQAYQDALNAIEASFFKPVQTHKCVHTEHCCIAHGCKYGYHDEGCPVYLGYQAQSYPCEHCQIDDDGLLSIEDQSIPRVLTTEVMERRMEWVDYQNKDM
jgi:hypothetical protein